MLEKLPHGVSPSAPHQHADTAIHCDQLIKPSSLQREKLAGVNPTDPLGSVQVYVREVGAIRNHDNPTLPHTVHSSPVRDGTSSFLQSTAQPVSGAWFLLYASPTSREPRQGLESSTQLATLV